MALRNALSFSRRNISATENLKSPVLEGSSKLPSYTVATLPDAALHNGEMVSVSDGNGGLPCLGLSDGSDWICTATGSPVSG